MRTKIAQEAGDRADVVAANEEVDVEELLLSFVFDATHCARIYRSFARYPVAIPVRFWTLSRFFVFRTARVVREISTKHQCKPPVETISKTIALAGMLFQPTARLKHLSPNVCFLLLFQHNVVFYCMTFLPGVCSRANI